VASSARLTSDRDNKALLEVDDLRVFYYTRKGPVKAVDGVSFALEKGDSLGIAGESGCGKSTTVLAMMRLIPRSGKIVSGGVFFDGVDLTKLTEEEFRKNHRWKKIAMVFQGSMNVLNPVFKVGDQIGEAIMLHKGVEKNVARARVREVLTLVGIDPSRADHYPHELSGGMKQRIVIAMALACDPDLVIADEPTTALDVLVQAQILKLIKNLRKTLNLSMILVSHDPSLIADICNRVAIMYAGKIVEIGGVVDVFTNPSHPYTQGLTRAIPSIAGEKKSLVSIPGQPPDLLVPPTGCRFHPRCPYAFDLCRRKDPSLTKLDNHYAACHLISGG